MRYEDEIEMIRATLGDDAARERIQSEAVAEPRLREELARRERVWGGLELAPPASAPTGFARRIVARAGAERSPLPGSPLSPRWARATAVLLLAIGVVGGAEIGSYSSAIDPNDAITSTHEVEEVEEVDELDGFGGVEMTMLDDYLAVLDDDGNPAASFRAGTP